MWKHLWTFVWNRKGKNALLILELAFSFLVLFGVYSFVLHNLERYNTPLGFETENRLIVHFNPPIEVDSAEVVHVRESLTREIRALSGVANTSFSFDITPFSNSNWVSTEDDNGYEISSNVIMADEDYADVMGLKLIEGRWLQEEDRFEKYSAIVISRQLREQVWADSSVLGKVIWWGNQERRIVGVVDHYKYLGEFREERNTIFEDFLPTTEVEPALNIEVKAGTPVVIEQQINDVLTSVARGWEFNVENLEESRKSHSSYTWIPIVAFLSVCLFLIINVALGLFGVLLYNVRKRRSEIGLRRAVGASPGSIFSQLMTETVLITSMGLLIGLFFAIQVPVLELFDISSGVYLWAGFWATFTVFVLVLLCTLYPGAQAVRIHPATALHEE